jgi:hypothetical protein
MSNLLLPDYINTRNKVDTLARVETPSACLTLTRSATLAITTVGTTITWQTETRNRNFSWSGTTITIPTDGYYSFFLFGTVNTNQINFFTLVSGGNLFTVSLVRAPTTVATAMYYLLEGATLTVTVIPSANVTLSANVRIDIVQMTGSTP